MNDWFEAEQRIERAQQLSESQRWAEALAEIDVALSINPHNAIWHAQRGYLLEELDRPEEAVDSYKAALEIEPDDPEVAVALGVVLSSTGRFSRALEIFERLAKRIPDLEAAYCHRIGIYAELGQHDRAEEMFYLAQELDDTCAQCFFHMGASLAARGKSDRAIYCWGRVLELDPDGIGVNRRIAQAYRGQGKLDLAREYYLREIREDPGNTDLLYELAELALEAGELAAAAAKFGQVLELDAGHVGSRFMLGKIWLLHGQPGQALTCFEAVRSLADAETELPDLERYVGEALFRLGRFAEARDHLTVAVEKKQDSVAALVLLGDTLLALGKASDASDAFRRLLALDAGNAVAHHKLAVCLIRQGQARAGLDHCLQAIRKKADFGVAMQTAVLAHLQLAEWSEARALLRRARRSAPQDAGLERLERRIWRLRVRHGLRRFAALFGWSKSDPGKS